MSQKIFLIGLPGAGKTTMGLNLAHQLGIQFVDLDQDIEKSEKLPISQIFQEKGEAHFRQLEKVHLEKVINTIKTFVMSTGGGTPCFFNNMELMNQAGITVFVNTPIDLIKQRLENDTSRPLMKSNSLEDLLAKRIEWYEQADHTIHEYKEIVKLFN